MKVYLTIAIDVPTTDYAIATSVIDDVTLTCTWEDEQNQINELPISVLEYRDSFEYSLPISDQPEPEPTIEVVGNTRHE